MGSTPNAAPNLRLGAALQFTQQELGGPVVENETNLALTAAATVVIEGNGDRVALIIVNNGVVDALIGTLPNIAGNVGIRLTANGGSVSMNVRDDFTLPTRRWYGLASGGFPQIYVLELTRFTKTPETP